MLKKDDPFVEGFRKWEGLHGPEEVASSSGETTLEPPSFEDAVMSFTQPNCRRRKRPACKARGHSETVDDTDSVSSGSMSRLWRQGCPESPEREGELELAFAEEEEVSVASHEEETEGDGLEDYLKQVIESPLLRKFCLICDTIDDQRSSTRRLHDVDTCANDLRLEMAHLSQCGMSVLMDVKLRTTENQRACASNCALTSTSL